MRRYDFVAAANMGRPYRLPSSWSQRAWTICHCANHTASCGGSRAAPIHDSSAHQKAWAGSENRSFSSVFRRIWSVGLRVTSAIWPALSTPISRKLSPSRNASRTQSSIRLANRSRLYSALATSSAFGLLGTFTVNPPLTTSRATALVMAFTLVSVRYISRHSRITALRSCSDRNGLAGVMRCGARHFLSRGLRDRRRLCPAKQPIDCVEDGHRIVTAIRPSAAARFQAATVPPSAGRWRTGRRCTAPETPRTPRCGRGSRRSTPGRAPPSQPR